MKTFKEFLENSLNEAKDDFLTPNEIKKLKAHYDGNPGLRNISQSIKNFEDDLLAFKKLKGNVHKSIKDDMVKTAARLRKLGKEDGVLDESIKTDFDLQKYIEDLAINLDSKDKPRARKIRLAAEKLEMDSSDRGYQAELISLLGRLPKDKNILKLADAIEDYLETL